MKYKLKTLFVVTALLALVVASFARDQFAQAEVRRLKEAVNASLSELDWLKSDDIDFSEFRSDFLLFSWGDANWNVELNDPTLPKIVLTWKSRLLFSRSPSVTLEYNKTPRQHKFAGQFLETIKEHEVEITVVKNGDQLFAN